MKTIAILILTLCSFSLLQLLRYSYYSESILIAVKVDGNVTLERIYYITVANVYARAGLFNKSDVDANVTLIYPCQIQILILSICEIK